MPLKKEAMDSTAIIAILSVFGLAPMTVFGFILLLKRQKHRVEELSRLLKIR